MAVATSELRTMAVASDGLCGGDMGMLEPFHCMDWDGTVMEVIVDVVALTSVLFWMAALRRLERFEFVVN